MKLNTYLYGSENRLTEQKPRLLLLHGMGGTGALWRPISASLENEFEILCPDQRGHGKSRPTPPASGFSPLDYAQDVVETCESLNFAPSWVVGHSMGVRTACGYAKLKPDEVLGLVLIDLGLSGVAGGGLGDFLAQFLGRLPKTFPNRAEARVFLENFCPDPSIAQYLLAVAQIDPADKTTLTFPFDHESLLQTIEASRGSVAREWVREFVTITHRPVYILRGENSRVFSKLEFEKEKQYFRDLSEVEFVEFQGCGHGLPFEKRKTFTDWLSEKIGISA